MVEAVVCERERGKKNAVRQNGEEEGTTRFCIPFYFYRRPDACKTRRFINSKKRSVPTAKP
ncbi:hypothetical protein PIB30_086231, partial [Stylosanthes scabra]|nr:hypothetical protein [Stylosanthes scabra]